MGQSTWVVPVLIDIIKYCETNDQLDVAETLANALEKIAPVTAERSACYAHFADGQSDISHLGSNVLAFPSYARALSNRAESACKPV